MSERSQLKQAFMAIEAQRAHRPFVIYFYFILQLLYKVLFTSSSRKHEN